MMEEDETPSLPGEESSQYFTHRDSLQMRDTKKKKSINKNSDDGNSSSYEEDGVFPPPKPQDSDSESDEEFIFPGGIMSPKGSSSHALEQQERVSAL